eukprot:184424-Pyramimonas_sp.AAC.1
MEGAAEVVAIQRGMIVLRSEEEGESGRGGVDSGLQGTRPCAGHATWRPSPPWPNNKRLGGVPAPLQALDHPYRL